MTSAAMTKTTQRVPPPSIEDKLYLAKYKLDEESHLIIRDQTKCAKCRDKPCMIVCPAEVYAWEQEQNVVSYDNCVECGACRVICPFDNIEWKYPRWGLGISHRYG